MRGSPEDAQRCLGGRGRDKWRHEGLGEYVGGKWNDRRGFDG